MVFTKMFRKSTCEIFLVNFLNLSLILTVAFTCCTEKCILAHFIYIVICILFSSFNFSTCILNCHSILILKLGVQVGLGPDHIVLDGDPAPPPQRRRCIERRKRLQRSSTVGSNGGKYSVCHRCKQDLFLKTKTRQVPSHRRRPRPAFLGNSNCGYYQN